MNTQKIWYYIYINFLSNLPKNEQEWWAEDFKGFIENIDCCGEDNAKNDDVEVEFKAGDRVCYKSHPNICIGYVSSDINLGNLSFIWDNVETILIPIHTSGAWAEHFGHGVCPNSMRVKADEIMLYTDDEK